MTSDSPPDQWLIRTAGNHISGPYSLQNIRDIIQQGKLELNDEVCHANAYWFYIHELQEVRNQLGIEVPKSLYSRKREDSTQTQTDTTDLERTDPELSATRMAPRAPARPLARESESVPELSQPIGEVGENTAVMSNRAFRDFRKKKTEPLPAQNGENPVLGGVTMHGAHHIQNGQNVHDVIIGRRVPGGVERSRIVHLFTYLMMMGAVVLLIAVIRLLQQRPV
jgi:hypothetical protein